MPECTVNMSNCNSVCVSSHSRARQNKNWKILQAVERREPYSSRFCFLRLSVTIQPSKWQKETKPLYSSGMQEEHSLWKPKSLYTSSTRVHRLTPECCAKVKKDKFSKCQRCSWYSHVPPALNYSHITFKPGNVFADEKLSSEQKKKNIYTLHKNTEYLSKFGK